MLPAARRNTRISRPALGLVIASLLLASILAVSTARNINREQRLMEDFLRREGLTLIRTFEAGARTTMMHRMSEDDPVATLVAETAREASVAYIMIVDDQGTVRARAGRTPAPPDAERVKRVLRAGAPVTRLNKEPAVYEVAREFRPVTGHGRGMMRQRWRQWCGRRQGDAGCEKNDPADLPRQAVFVGLTADRFVEARAEDLRQSLFMGAILFMMGSAGLYFIFLYQNMQTARATLADMEIYTANVINSMPAGLITLDEAGRLVSFNQRAAEISGADLEPYKGKNLADSLSSWPEEINGAETEVSSLPVDWPHGHGAVVPVEISSSRIQSRDGRPLGRVLILRDMRDIRDMEEMLERSRRLAALGKMAAGIAHEIRNPLGTIKGFAQFLAERATDEASREYARLMIGETDRLNHTVSALLQFARPREPVFKDFAVADLLSRAARLMEADLKDADIELEISCPKGLICNADPDLILQVLLNLLKNAIAASSRGADISIAASRDRENLVIEIRDQGRGMEDEERKRMFDPFYTTRRGGTGLGLAVSHQIVEQHRGHFEVESEPGRGTAIRIILPLPTVHGSRTEKKNG